MEKEKATEKKDVRDSWDKYTCGSFLKADDITSPDDPYVCIDIYEVEEDSGDERLRIEIERKELGLKTPKEVVGKMIYFVTPLGWNPSDKKEQPVVRISKIT